MTRIRLGLHRMSGRLDESFKDYVERARPNVVKFLDPGGGDEALAAFCRQRGTEVIGRVFFDPQELGAEGGRQIEAVLDAARGLPSIKWWELHNEAWQSGDLMSRYAELSLDFMNRVDALGTGQKAVIGCFSTGQPEVSEWVRFAPAIDHAARHGHALGLHCYSAPLMWYGVNDYQFNGGNAHLGPELPPSAADLGWWTLRYRRALAELDRLRVRRPQILITESGIDDIQPRPGPHEGKKGFGDYLDVHWTQDFGDYVRQMAWYCRELSLDREVLGVVDFGFAHVDPQWRSFDLGEKPAIFDKMRDTMAALRDEGDVTPVVVAPAGPGGAAPLQPAEQTVRAAIEVRPGEGFISVARRALGREPKHADVELLRATNRDHAGLDPGDRLWLPAEWFAVRALTTGGGAPAPFGLDLSEPPPARRTRSAAARPRPAGASPPAAKPAKVAPARAKAAKVETTVAKPAKAVKPKVAKADKPAKPKKSAGKGSKGKGGR